MNEVEKMYENCNIKPKQKGYCDWDSNCPYPHHKCNDECPYWEYEDIAKYPPFTAEKQLELMKWLALRDDFGMMAWQNDEYHIEHDKYNADENSLEGCLARLINNLWQDLTEEERKQIKEILE